MITTDFEKNSFAFLVSDAFAKRIKKSTAEDPLLRQILPSSEELDIVNGFCDDPLGEQRAKVTPCLLHKYYGRVLLLVTKKCALHCRFCFRKNLRFSITKKNLQQAFAYIANDLSINEVILSGGDPLMLADQKLKALLQKLAKISHIKRLRIHTRIPVALPKRITAKLIAMLKSTRFTPMIVIHCNHAQEIDQTVITAINKLRKAGFTLLNQSVLLHGVNDSVAAQVALSEALGSAGVLPYYLHLLDKVSGTAHFAVSLPKAKKIYREMQRLLPGFLVPKLAHEKAGAASKIMIG